MKAEFAYKTVDPGQAQLLSKRAFFMKERTLPDSYRGTTGIGSLAAREA